MEKMYQICANCVMDTSDSNILFNDEGICDHCIDFQKNTLPGWQPNEDGRLELLKTIEKIKLSGKGKPFDCIIGMSGGLDSSYLVHVAVAEFGLRPLVFHVDGGWNTDLAVNNIQMLVDGLNLNLFTEVINWRRCAIFNFPFLRRACLIWIFLRIMLLWQPCTILQINIA